MKVLAICAIALVFLLKSGIVKTADTQQPAEAVSAPTPEDSTEPDHTPVADQNVAEDPTAEKLVAAVDSCGKLVMHNDQEIYAGLDPISPGYGQTLINRIQERDQRILSTLAASEDPIMRLIAYRLDDVTSLTAAQRKNLPTLDIAGLADAVQRNEVPPAVAHDLVHLCQEPEAGEQCTGVDTIALLEQADGSNAAAWLIIAREHARAQDAPATLAALEQAATAPIYEDYAASWALDTYVALRDVAPGLPRSERVMRARNAALNLTGALRFNSLYPMCNEFSATDEIWRDRCLAVGQRLIRDASEQFEASLGAAILKETYQGLGDADSGSEATAKLLEVIEQSMSAEVLSRQLAAFSIEPEWADRYIEDWAATGQMGANQKLDAKFDATLETGLTHPCLPPKEGTHIHRANPPPKKTTKNQGT